MRQSDAKKLGHGVYRIYWKEGGCSLAAVGSDHRGDRWYAPTNWVSGPSFRWTPVERVEAIVIDEVAALREAWLDVPWEGQVPKGDGHWIQALINAATAIVDPDGALRADPAALLRGRIATERRRFANAVDQLALAAKYPHTPPEVITQNEEAKAFALAELEKLGADLGPYEHLR